MFTFFYEKSTNNIVFTKDGVETLIPVPLDVALTGDHIADFDALISVLKSFGAIPGDVPVLLR